MLDVRFGPHGVRPYTPHMHAAMWVFLGGGTGAVLRWLAGQSLGTRRLPAPGSDASRELAALDLLPIATLAVNVLGCLLIGLLVPVLTGKPEPWKAALIVGLLGGFTTFSAFGHETLAMLQHGRPLLASAYAIGSIMIGLAAVWLGSVITHGLGFTGAVEAIPGSGS